MKAIVNNSCCQILYREKLPRKTVGKTIEVEFSEDWEGLAITAVFEAGDVKKDVVYTGEPVIIPHEVLATEGLSVMLGFHGALPDGTIVKRTVPEWLNNVSASLDPSGETSSKPTPDWAAQVQTIALEAKEAADSVRSDAQAGKFNGSAGDDGGWYTPAVTQPDENTLRVAFTPSKEDMPAVADTDITLPAGGGGGGSGGGSGEDGGYYTPTVTQTAENTMQVAFTPSKTTMPAVPGTEITLPEGPAGKPGAGGKSAYAYAVEGGYAGTEAEFSAKMAAEIPTVDSTLTKARQAADAAEVGNRLSALSEEIVTTAESKVAAHNTGTDTHSDIRLLIQGLIDRLNALADSDDTTLDQLSEVVAYIKSNRELIAAITTDKVSVADIIDNLTTNVTNKPLSAAQGVALKALIDAITVPEALPNPNALTFTGAVTGSYDGSAPLEVAIPSGGADCTIAVDMLASGTVAQGSEDPVDTGITLGKLKEYKMFILSVSGVSNVNLHNWYTKIGDFSISRVNNVRGQTILYEFLNTEKTVMIARNGTNGNHSVYESYEASSITYGVNNASYFPDCIYELSSISESTHVITYPIKSDTVDVKWTILGVVK